MNNKDSMKENKRKFCEYMELEMANNNLKIETADNGRQLYILDNDEDRVVMDSLTGRYLNTLAGEHKSNKRQYVKIKWIDWFCPNYTFRVVFEGLMLPDKIHVERYEAYKEEKKVINHINGNTEDNSDNNIEVTTPALNNAHGRLMSELAYYNTGHIRTEYDCQGNAMHQWEDGIGVTCKQIEEYNATHENQIKAFKNKNGEFRPHFTYDELIKILLYFNKL